MARSSQDRSTDDPVRLYFDDIGKKPLLDKEAEIRLAKRIEAGREAEEVLESGKELSASDKRKYRMAARKGEAARQEFLTSNLRLVVSIAKRYTGSGIDLLDLIQEGNLGLMHAIEKFDWRKGFKFSTYATWWIRQAISRGISNTGHTIRVPVHAEEAIQRIKKTQSRLEMDLGRTPTRDELAEHVGMTVQSLEEHLQIDTDTVSLSAPVGEDVDSSELSDRLPDLGVLDPDEGAVTSLLGRELAKIMTPLSEQEREILFVRAGIGSSRGLSLTYEEASEVLDMPKEQVRQLEQRAMSKLRHPSSDRGARDFL